MTPPPSLDVIVGDVDAAADSDGATPLHLLLERMGKHRNEITCNVTWWKKPCGHSSLCWLCGAVKSLGVCDFSKATVSFQFLHFPPPATPPRALVYSAISGKWVASKSELEPFSPILCKGRKRSVESHLQTFPPFQAQVRVRCC